MRKHITQALLISALSIWMLPTAHAKEHSYTTDSNGDGGFSREEMIHAGVGRMEKRFDRVDTNKDGQLTQDETKGRGRRGFAKKADANKDGVISKVEAKKHIEVNVDRRLEKKDSNRYGVISKEERTRRMRGK